MIEKERHQLIQFIREEIGEFKMPIDSTTQLENDLGVTGDDAIELIQKFSTVFKVDIQNFNFQKYFHPEPTFSSTYGQITPLSIKDLENAIDKGELT